MTRDEFIAKYKDSYIRIRTENQVFDMRIILRSYGLSGATIRDYLTFLTRNNYYPTFGYVPHWDFQHIEAQDIIDEYYDQV